MTTPDIIYAGIYSDDAGATKYIRHDLYETLEAENARLRKALKNIAVYDLYYCSSVEDTDFQEQAKNMYETAREALAQQTKE